jgi:hypothetical protein
MTRGSKIILGVFVAGALAAGYNQQQEYKRDQKKWQAIGEQAEEGLQKLKSMPEPIPQTRDVSHMREIVEKTCNCNSYECLLRVKRDTQALTTREHSSRWGPQEKADMEALLDSQLECSTAIRLRLDLETPSHQPINR